METKINLAVENTVITINGEFIRDLRKSLGESLSVFGLRLARAVDPKAKQGYSRQYISGLEHDKPQYRLTPELEAALWNIAAGIDDVPAGTGGAVLIKVLAQPGQVIEGAMIPRTAKVVKCANPRCNVTFIKVNPFQRYHDPECSPYRGHK